MKILITGSTGFIGKNLCKLLKKEKKKQLFFITRSHSKKKNYFNCNLNNRKKLRLILHKIKPQIIINLAAIIDFKKNSGFALVNQECPGILAKFSKMNNCHLVQASTISIHGNSNFYNQKSKIKPLSAYAKSKYIADNKIINSRCKYTIIRFGGIFGKNGPSHLGLNVFINNSLKKKISEFKGNLLEKRNYIYVKDAAKLIIFCIKKKKYGIYYACGETLNFYQMIKYMNKILGNYIKNTFAIKRKKTNHQIIENTLNIKFKKFKDNIKDTLCK